MLEINKYKVNLYNLLFENPLCNFRRTVKDTVSEINVLFIGESEKAIETFKTMFWASQYPDCMMNMTIAGAQSDIEIVKNELSDHEKYPALDEYLDKGYAGQVVYACMKGIFADGFDKRMVKDDICNLDFDHNLYSYVIVATGNSELAWSYLEEVESVVENMQEKIPHILLAVYNDELNDKFSRLTWDKIAKNVVMLQFEKSEDDINDSDLYRIAGNVNLAYNMKCNHRLSIKDTMKEFMNLCFKEYGIKDYKGYNADSSYASAVHISSKLVYCVDYSEKVPSKNTDWKEYALGILAEAIKTRNGLFDKLMVLEHRRWNAYMISRGYRFPNKDERNFIYDGKHKNYDSDRKLHMCLCESGNRLNPDMNKKEFWKKLKYELTPLDYASFYCNNVATKYSKDLYKEIYNKYPFLNSVLFLALKEVVEGLFADEKNANARYRKVFQATIVKEEIKDDKKLLSSLQEMNKDLQIVLIRNQRINFFEYDAQLVDMLPFCLWYGKDYEEVVVFTRGIASEDVVIPTLLYAKITFFVSEEELSEKYKKVVKDYFMSRGNNTSSYFMTYGEFSEYAEKNGIIDKNLVVTGDGHAKGMFFREYKDVAVIDVRYDVKCRLIDGDAQADADIFFGLEKQSYSVDEFIKLLGGDIEWIVHDELDKQTYNVLEKIFWDKYSIKKTNGLTGKKKREWIPWNECAKIFKECRAIQEDQNISVGDVNGELIYVFDNMISEKIYTENGIQKLLQELNDFYLIRNLKCVSRDDGIVKISFITYHKEIIDALKGYCYEQGKNNIFKKDLSLCKMFESRKIEMTKNNVLTYRTKNYVVSDNEKYNKAESQFYSDLEKLGYLSNVEIVNGEIKSLVVKNNKVREFIQFEGDILEKIVYHKMRDSGYFDDVCTGVHILWNKLADITPYELVELKKKLKEQSLKNQNGLGLVTIPDLCRFRNEICESEKIKTDEKKGVKQELDVIAIRGMQAYFISCKSRLRIETEHLNEIAYEASKAGAIAVMATCLKVNEAVSDSLKERVDEDKITVWGRDELRSDNYNLFE